MTNNKSGIPKLRFPGYTEPWEQRKLGELADIVGGGTPSTNNDEYWNGDIDWYSPVEINNQIYVSGSKNKITELGLQKSSAKVLPIGTVLFTSRAGIGKTAILAKKGTTNQGFQSILPHENKLDSYFIFSRTDELKRYGETNGAGSTFVEVSGKQMSKMPIMLPKIEEQMRIGTFFQQLDNLITLHQRKLDDLKTQKKGLLQKMFPKNGEDVPEVRFPEFTGTWKRRKWIDTVDMSTNMVDPKTGKYDKLLHIGPGNIEPFTGRILDNVNTVKDDNLISGKFHFNSNDIIYGKINPQLAKYTHVNFEGLASADTYVLNSKNGITQDFLYVELQTSEFYKYSVSVSMRTGMPKINRDELNKFNYLVPKNVEEQQKIGTFFQRLDNLITLHQRKIEHLQLQKKGLLQQMFV
ncbi:restriction endonuclease subunit S [Liquorilactobacillus nagelii]|uniref:restriction endonuclease subunit S n=1 Tax=Liquorilactobacillus nagelii TaxID=82688 RepID=UPI0006F194EE|nr:restriction endonuclease subunit S [Liquorilactobacillus nagelii]KRL40414.1 HsdS subunit [Liquorilactobacillus nagelii DSM 13675]QYH54363.1 restriction endonuclease subunit S [Liquorilactobacillus nagelii DSM 13675]